MRAVVRYSLVVCFILSAALCASPVSSFAEEPIGFRDPATNLTYDPEEEYPEVSTLHLDLTYALALAAGFSVSDSQILEIYNQLVDSEVLPGSGDGYTNCAGSFADQPDPTDLYPGCGLGCSHLIWPRWDDMQDSETCTTSRFGPYSPFFHFPHMSGEFADRDLGALHDWAWGTAPELIAYEAYAWGKPTDMTVMQANYRYIETVTVDTDLVAGSLEAFATYLHTLADAYSHEDCIAVMDAIGMEWATHTLDDTYQACKYNPANPQNDDVHGVEYGDHEETERTINAAHAVYDELSQRSQQREGVYYPLPLDTVLVVDGQLTTLEGAVESFVTNWDFSEPAERRDYVDLLVAALFSVSREETQKVFVPVAISE